ncbi:hypothetical protein [Amycolatopsis mediterranei]|uniref:hypothetical protein n=1 Tax=Amycolatopsis mediterranei TaxID=33910 RepID=UPI0012BD4ED7|nr:hypothetical protein [Amycolatopsis mediterranei]UZF68486.1 hypothetical protein ISP_001563 [Amycolatopsis mediterranei]
MLFGDGKVRADYTDFVERQIADVRRVHAGEEDLSASHAEPSASPNGERLVARHPV